MAKKKIDREFSEYARKKMTKAAGSKLGIATRAMPRNEVLKLLEKYGKYKAPKALKAIKKVPKASIAKRVLGKTLSKAIPGVGAAIIARDVVKGISKATCSKRGGKWVEGKCAGARKTKLKAGSKVRDPISKR